MGLYKKYEFGISYLKNHLYGRYQEMKKYRDPKRLEIMSMVELSKEQKEAIDDFYMSHYGKRIPYTWHQHYYAFTRKFDAKYFPELLAIPEYEWLINPETYSFCLEDKNILPFIAHGISDMETPRLILSCAGGIYRNQEGYICKADAEKVLNNCGKAFIKPSVDSGSGKDCRVIECHQGHDQRTGDSIEKLLEQYGKNFVIQECIATAKEVSSLHPESVNTFRVITYILNDRIYHVPTIMRIGSGNNHLDNAHAGGMFIGIDDAGNMLEQAYTEFHKVYTVHPDTKIEFKTHQIPAIEKVHKAAHEMHSRIPQVGMVNWDFTINQDGNPVLIEANIRNGSVWLSQMAWGKGLFEENTAAVLEFCRDMRSKRRL